LLGAGRRSHGGLVGTMQIVNLALTGMTPESDPRPYLTLTGTPPIDIDIDNRLSFGFLRR
jgi:hypothetical protein